MVTKSFNNFEGGYTREQALWQEDLCQMVEGSRNVEIFPKEDEGYGVRSMLGNTQYAVIADKAIYNLHEYETESNRYLLAHTGDTVQELNETLKTWTVLKSGLTVTATTASLVDLVIDDINTSTRRHYMFFTNGVDAPFIYEKGNVPAVQDVTATGVDGHTIRGNIAACFDQRVFIADGATLYWSKQLDPFNFSTAEDAGYKRFEGIIKAVNVDRGVIIVSTTNGFQVGTSASGQYTWQALGANIAYNNKSMVTYGSATYYATDNGIYPVTTTESGVNQTGSTISYTIDTELSEISSAYREKMQLINATRLGRDEMWIHIPMASGSVVYIFRGKKGKLKYSFYLPPRYQQKVNDFCVFKDMMLSCTSGGKVLEELRGLTYDGTFYPSIVVTPKIHFDNYSGKIKVNPILFISGDADNNFYVQTYVNGSEINYVEKQIVMGGSVWASDPDDLNGLLWAASDDDSEGGTWAAMTLGRVKLNKAKSKSKEFERCLQFKFLTKHTGDSFSVQALDLTKVRKISK